MTDKKRSTPPPARMASKPSRVAALPESIPPPAAVPTPAALLTELRTLILATRVTVSQVVNSALVLLYWQIGQRILTDILKARRATYGEEILQTLSAKLTVEFGRGFSQRNLASMVRFAEVFPDAEVMHALSVQLSWSHFIQVIYLDEPIKRDFYAGMCRVERWSTRTLASKIDGMLFERTALSKKPEKLAAMELQQLREEDKLTPDLVFRDPYLLGFLGLKDTYSEKDLESAILREIESFILELGVGFAFVERQKRITVDGEDFYLDLLFYHRHLRRLVAIELKLGEFKPGHMGQMELYLRWLDRYERKEGEEQPIGLILCAGGRRERIELLDLERSGIRVASYWTEVLPKKVLERKLHEAVRLARARLPVTPTGTFEELP